MNYVITVKITYLDDLFHNEALPDGPTLIQSLHEDFDAITDLGDRIEIELLREEEV